MVTGQSSGYEQKNLQPPNAPKLQSQNQPPEPPEPVKSEPDSTKQ
jgi:hypothetical protein